jgi:RIMS-binding protein 2
VVRAAARNRQPQQMRTNQMQQRGGMGGPTQLPMNPQQQQQQQQQQMHQQQMQPGMPQQVIEHDENLSDKEVFPGSMHQQQMVSLNYHLCVYFASIFFLKIWES